MKELNKFFQRKIVTGKKYILPVLFSLCFFCLFGGISRILTPRWNVPQLVANVTDSLEHFEKLPTDAIDIAFLGTSHMAHSVSPMLLYQEDGFLTYNIATNSQPLAVSLCLTERLFRNQHPRALVLDVSNLFFSETSEGWYRYLMDSQITDYREKTALYKAYLNDNGISAEAKTKQEQFVDWIETVFPFFKYHDRWNQLSLVDLKTNKNYFLQGYVMSPWLVSTDLSLDEMNAAAEQILVYQKNRIVKIEGNTQKETVTEDPLYKTEIPAVNLSYLKKIKELCEKNDCQLILTKIPDIGLPYQYGSAWTKIRHEIVAELASELDLTFLDLLYDIDLDIDWTIDTQDRGNHLNYRGAKKVTAFWGEYLKTDLGLSTKKSALYDQKLPLYNKAAAVAELQTTTLLSDYFEQIQLTDEDYSIFIAARDDMRQGLSAKDIDMLHSFGLQTDFDAMQYQDSYIAVVKSGTVVYEACSNRRQTYEDIIGKTITLEMESAGYLSGDRASIRINGTEYAVNGRGINIVVYDNSAKQVVDSVCFDTWNPEHTVVHNTGNLLFIYEQYLMDQGE